MALRRPGADPHIQKVLKDTYRIVEFIGQGAMGRVYKGEHLKLKKPIVIKVLGDEVRGSDEIVARFRKEAILQAMVNHPCAVQTIDLDQTEDGTLFVVLEFAPGEPLDKLIELKGRLPVARAVDIMRQVLEILSVAHEAKIYHRDLKPENILVERRPDEDVVRVLDFGIAVLLSEGPGARSGGGIPYYMAPEAAAGEEVDGRADLYSMGVIAYQMLTGELPIHDENPDRFLGKLINEYPPKISEGFPDIEVPRQVEETIFTSLSKDPFNRFQTASETLDALGGTSPKKSRKFLLVAVAAMALAAVAIGFVLTRDNYSDTQEVAAESARAVAAKTHPGFAAAEQLWQQAESARTEGNYPESYKLYRSAQEAFARCVPYLDADQKEAERAKLAAVTGRPDHPLTRLGLEKLAAAEQQIAKADYEGSYRTFKTAALCFRYDDAPEKSALAARAKSVSDHPAHARAERMFVEANTILQKRPLVDDDLALAQRKFSDAAAEFGRAVAYDASHQEQADAAKSTADPANPRFQDFIQLMADAAVAQAQADYSRAYALYDEAREGFKTIGRRYDSSQQDEAEAMRTKADPTSPLYAQGQSIFDEAVQARSRGDYTLSYTKFREARDIFARAVSYNSTLMETARELRVKADRKHPAYAEGEKAFQEGGQKKDALDFAGADADFQRAIDFYTRARPYDSSAERAADRARRRAYERMPVSYPAGMAAMDAAEKARAGFDYETAYEHFKKAEEQFKRARFDDSVLLDLIDAKRNAKSGSSVYGDATRAEQEAETALQSGDAERAQDRYDAAVRLYRQAAIASTGGGDNTGGGSNTSNADRQAERQAKRTKQDSEEWKDTTDGWNRAGEINRQTRQYYEDATRIHAEGIAAWNAKNWALCQTKFSEAVDLYRKVSNKKR